jgi:hypothetical protein
MTSREVALAPVTTASAVGRWFADQVIPVIPQLPWLHSSSSISHSSSCRSISLVIRGIDPSARPSPVVRPACSSPCRRPADRQRSLGLCRRLWSHASVPELTQIVRDRPLGSVISIVLAAAAVPGDWPGDDELEPSFWISSSSVPLP